MGKSTPACFRIIGCGGDSVDHDDLQTPESKASSDRRGWSFRKRSDRHRVLSNNVTSEVPASASKESQEATVTVAEKTREIQQREEKTIEFQQKEEKTVEIQQKEEKTTDIQQKEESATEIQHTGEKITEIQHTEEKPTEIQGKEEKSTEIQQKEDISTEILQNEAKITEIQQKEEKTAEIQQRDERTAEIQQREEKTEELQQKDDSKLSDTKASCEDDLGADGPPDETGIILIQTAIRGFLARRDVLRQKSATKLQAVVRGHIVRSHAVGTLRCIQAIVRMQALVRARRPHLKNKKEANKASHSYTYISIEKLLGNAFARQLMEATPRSKPINIKCSPSKSDSAWTWLERWMSVSSVSKKVPHETESAVEEQKDNVDSACNGEDITVQIISKSMDSESGFDASDDVSSDNFVRKSDADSLDVDSRKFIQPLSSNLHNSDQSDSICEVKESAPIVIKNTDIVEVMEPECLPKKEESQNEEEVLNEVVEVEHIPAEIVSKEPDSAELSSMPSETEVKKLSRKASNPAFIAAQSKFEELSLGATSPQLSTSSSHDPGVESSLDKDSSANQDQPFSSDDKDGGLAGNSNFTASAVQLGSSECGTELSVSSTLDSPARSEEAGVNDSGRRETNASDRIDHPENGENSEVEAKSIVLETDPSSNDTPMLERKESVDAVYSESPNSAIPAADTPQLDKPDVELGSETRNKLSPEASPRNDTSIPELLATPSSQGSIKPKKSKGEKSKSGRKSKPSPDHKSLSNHTPDSASRGSLEQLQEHKPGKRRNSLGSAKSDLKEQEARDSSSSISLPSYMQATESARAKAIANGSPRSSPDVNDKEIHIKKRHSLPGSNDRQGSPRINRSLSQAQQNPKGSASQSPQDRKWRR